MPASASAKVSLLDTSKHSFTKDVLGFIAVIVVALPFWVPYVYFLRECPTTADLKNADASPPWKQQFCDLGMQHPGWFCNFLLFLSMDVTFWLYSLLVDSTWIVDPYWTLIPVFIMHSFLHHPLAIISSRAVLASALLYLWAVRLTYNYFRREEWHFGVREDWRYAEMRQDARLKNHWWWMSFFAGFVVQHAMLYLASMPLLFLYMQKNQPDLNAFDLLASAVTLIGIGCEWVADYQLRNFMLANEARARAGKPKVLVLDEGIWYYSRHPNYFGEQTFWWGIFLFAYNIGHTEAIAGALLITTLFFGASLHMVEARILRNKERKPLYEAYIKRTSAFLPLPKFGSSVKRQ